MAVNSQQILVGTPDQLTTGAILSAPLGTTVPTSAVDTIDTAFIDCGYISSDGLQLTPSNSTADINDWSGALVRRIIQTFDGTLAWQHLETNAASLGNAFGAENVTETAATQEHGNQLAARLGAHLPTPRAWVFKIKDGDTRVLIVVPNGQITNVDAVTFSSSDAVKWAVTLSAYADASGQNIYIYVDDGQTA